MSHSQTPLTRCVNCRTYLDAPDGSRCAACAKWRPTNRPVPLYNLRLAPATLPLLLLGLAVIACVAAGLIHP